MVAIIVGAACVLAGIYVRVLYVHCILLILFATIASFVTQYVLLLHFFYDYNYYRIYPSLPRVVLRRCTGSGDSNDVCVCVCVCVFVCMCLLPFLFSVS